jgi:hypothetical protein
MGRGLSGKVSAAMAGKGADGTANGEANGEEGACGDEVNLGYPLCMPHQVNLAGPRWFCSTGTGGTLPL